MLFLLILVIAVFWLIGEVFRAIGIGIAMVIGGGSIAWYLWERARGKQKTPFHEIVNTLSGIMAVGAAIYAWYKVDIWLGVFTFLIIGAIGGSVAKSIEDQTKQ